MRFSIVLPISFVTIAALFLAQTNASPVDGVAAVPSDGGRQSPEDLYKEEIFQWKFPKKELLKPFDYPPDSLNPSKCSVDVVFRSSTCGPTSMGVKFRVLAYDQRSQNLLEGKVEYHPKRDGDVDEYYRFVAQCGTRYKFYATDTPEIPQRIGLLGFRLDVNEHEHALWRTDNPDEETGKKSTQVVSPSFSEFGTHKGNNKNFSQKRGYAQTLITSKVKHEKAYLQVC